jgi:hypothetical protein
MELIVDLAETRLQYVRVNLRRRKVGVSQHCLNRTKVRASLEEMRGKRVT